MEKTRLAVAGEDRKQTTLRLVNIATICSLPAFTVHDSLVLTSSIQSLPPRFRIINPPATQPTSPSDKKSATVQSSAKLTPPKQN